MKLTKILCTLSTVALLASIGCKKDDKKADKDKTPSAGKTTTTTDTPPKTEKKWTAQDTLAVWTRCGEAFNAHDAKKAAECYGKDGQMTMIDWQGPEMDMKGGDAIVKALGDYWKSMPDVKSTPQLTLVNGNHVAAITLDEGTNTGEMMGMPPTGKKISVFAAMLTETDGKSVKDRMLGDQSTWSHQLGMFKSETAPDSEKAWESSVTAVATDADKAKIDANVAVIKNFDAAMAKQDMETIKAHIADDVSFRYVPMKSVTSGAEAYLEGMAGWGSMFESMSRDVKEIWGAGDWVVAVVENKAKLGVDIENPKKASTKGKEVTTTQITFYKVVDSKVAAHWVFENAYAFAVQAGLADPPPAGGHDDAKGAPADAKK